MKPPAGLEQVILYKIATKQQSEAQISFATFSIIAVASFAGVIPAFFYLLRSFSQSGFYEYLSLIFSDTSIAITYRKELLFTFFESLPIIGLVLFLGAVVVFLWSLSHAGGRIKNLRRARIAF